MKKIYLMIMLMLSSLGGWSQTNSFPATGNAMIYQGGSSFRAYDVVNTNGIIVSRFESTSDASGQLWFKDAAGNYKVAIRSNSTYPSAIAGELVVGEFTLSSKGKKFYVSGDSWMNGRLDVDGIIRSEEVKVEVFNGPDYVFEEDYNLRSLLEIKEYIQLHKHLPEIPSAKEMEKNGIELGDMNMKLLKKIEELTLYQIELMERLEIMEKNNERMARKIQELEGTDK